jgi:hypothetical protein
VPANLNPAILKNGAGGIEQVLSGDSAAVVLAVRRRRSSLPLAGVLPSNCHGDRVLAAPYSQPASPAAEHLLARDLSASVAYFSFRGVKLYELVTPVWFSALVPPIFGPGRANPQLRDIHQFEDSAGSNLSGTELRPRTDHALDFTKQPQNPLDASADWAVSLQRQTNRRRSGSTCPFGKLA